MNFYARGKNLLLIGKNVLILMVSILTNKDMFESSYDDLKFTVQNCNYIFTNLVKIFQHTGWRAWWAAVHWVAKT